MRHWFDGFAMLHRFGIADGEVSYANRFLQTKAYRAAEETGEIVYSEFATDPCRSLFARVFSIFSPKISDNANVNLVKLGERYISMTETPIPVEFDGETLETVGVAYKPPGLLTTAHPHLDRASGGMLNYAAKLGPRNRYRFFLLPPGAGEAAGDRPSCPSRSRPTCTPSASPSAGWCWPSSRSWSTRSAFRSPGRPYIENYRWKPELGTRFTLVDRDTGEATGPFETDPFFCFHHVERLRGGRRGRGRRLHLRRRADHRGPLPRAPARGQAGRPGRAAPLPDRHRLAEGEPRAAGRGARAAADQLRPPQRAPLPLRLGRRRGVGLARPDRQGRHRGAREPIAWSEDGCSPGEPVFVAAPGLEPPRTRACCSRSSSTRARAARSCSSSTPRTSRELARAEAPHHIPYGFHGQFVSG